MRERPILFQGAMVRAILSGAKTQTRRAMARQKKYDFTDYTLFGQQGHNNGEWKAIEHAPDWPDGKEDQCRCPYASHRGDRLWVRESFMHSPAEYEPTLSMTHASRPAETAYRADFPDSQPGEGWKPSIHMPRKLCRLELEVTDVRIERLQSISEADALAEGIEAMRCPDCHLAAYGLPGWGHDELNPTAKGAYRFLWESINGAGSWDRNDWVWAVSFRRVTS